MLKEYKNSKKQGDAGVGAAIAYFCKEGWHVSIPLTDSQDYDLVIDYGDGLKSVQVKTTTFKTKRGIFNVSLTTKGGNRTWNGISKSLVDSSVDFLFVITKNGDKYLFPMSEMNNRSTINLGKKYQKYKVE